MVQEKNSHLYNILFGTPLSYRTQVDDQVDATILQLDEALQGMLDVIERELGPSDAATQAMAEWERVIDLPGTSYANVAAKRAAFMFSLWQEKDVRNHYINKSSKDAELVDLLGNRILPLVMPRFIANLAQMPESLVMMTSILTDMWDPQDLGAALPESHP